MACVVGVRPLSGPLCARAPVPCAQSLSSGRPYLRARVPGHGDGGGLVGGGRSHRLPPPRSPHWVAFQRTRSPKRGATFLRRVRHLRGGGGARGAAGWPSVGVDHLLALGANKRPRGVHGAVV